ncbi:GCG_CRPN prefix-to-repeats domain-containing protein [Afipia sp. TerB]
MKKLFVAALFASTIAGFGAANAMSPAPVAPAGGDMIQQVAGGCGRGFHRDRFGRCRVNRGRVVVRPPVVRKCRYWGPGRRVCRTWW